MEEEIEGVRVLDRGWERESERKMEIKKVGEIEEILVRERNGLEIDAKSEKERERGNRERERGVKEMGEDGGRDRGSKGVI